MFGVVLPSALPFRASVCVHLRCRLPVLARSHDPSLALTSTVVGTV